MREKECVQGTRSCRNERLSPCHTFPDKYLLVQSVVQDVAVIFREHVLFEGILFSHQGYVHGAVSIWNLVGRKTITLSEYVFFYSLKRWLFTRIYQIERCHVLVHFVPLLICINRILRNMFFWKLFGLGFSFRKLLYKKKKSHTALWASLVSPEKAMTEIFLRFL